MSNEIGLSYGTTINDLNNNLPKGRGDCFDYGSTFGCDCYCPTFREGKCKIEDVDAFKKMIKKDEWISKEDVEEIYKMYPQLLEV